MYSAKGGFAAFLYYTIKYGGLASAWKSIVCQSLRECDKITMKWLFIA